MKTDFSNCTILICDDNLTYRKYFKKFVEIRFKVKVVETDDPGEAFNYLNAHLPDLIIMDMQMPVMDGYTAIKMLRSNTRTKNIPIIAFTAFTSVTLIEGLKRLKINDYIVKPSTEEIVFNKIYDILSRIESSETPNTETPTDA